MALVKFLIAKRKAVGMSQQVLAKQLGQHQSFVARLESGQRRVDIVEFIELAAILSFDAGRMVREITKVNR
jgi:transcriptional regulator with XRE-family HTH domain